MFSKAAYTENSRFEWATFGIILLFHLVAPFAFFTFSWPGLITFVVLSFITGSIGISLCYHRLLTHHSFRAPKWLTYLTTLIACLNLEGGPIFSRMLSSSCS
jgi:stearoyl-CoA desaturase (delta-9 desaturase)